MIVQEAVYRHLTDNGLIADGTNQIGAVNGSVTPVALWGGPLKKKWAIHRLIVVLEDNAVLNADNYGGLSALTNGLQVRMIAGDEVTGEIALDLLGGSTIKNHVDWAAHAYDLQEHVFGSGNNFVAVRWTFSHGGRPLLLDSFQNDKLVVTINDDLSSLVLHEFIIQGHIFDEISEHLITWGTS